MSLSNLYIETPRLVIRPFALSDIEPSYQMNLDPEVSRYTGDGGIVTLEEIGRRIQEDVFGDYEKYGYGRLAVIHKEDKRFIGFSGLKYLSDLKKVDLGYRFLSEYWDRGIATEAGKACIELGFEKLGLSEIIAMVLPQNEGSIRVLQKLGFILDSNMIENGQPVDIYVLSK